LETPTACRGLGALCRRAQCATSPAPPATRATTKSDGSLERFAFLSLGRSGSATEIRDRKFLPARSAASPSEEWCKKAGEVLTSVPHAATREGQPRDPGLARSSRTRINCRSLGSEVAGARGKGTGARIPYLKKNRRYRALGLLKGVRANLEE